MKKLTTILLFFCFSCFSQSYEITYNMEQVAKNINLTTNIKTYLKGNGINSICVQDFRNSFQKSDNSFMNMPTENNPTFYKDLRMNLVVYNDHIRFKFFNIVDQIPTFDWNITSETKEILGYQCQKATLNFRGRDFTVYFTSEINISDGPIKFSGLPGLILEVISDDSVASFHFLAETIKISKDFKTIENSYAGKETILYSDFLQKYNEKYKESLSKIINEQGETRPMSKGFMEVLIK